MDVDAIPWGEMGVVSAIVVVVLVGIWAAKDVVLALLRSPRMVKSRGETPGRPGPRTIAWAERLTVDQVKAQAERAGESQDDRMDRLEARIEKCFEVEGKHREEVMHSLLSLRTKMERLHDRYTDKNSDQDRALVGLATGLATLQGMMTARRDSLTPDITEG